MFTKHGHSRSHTAATLGALTLLGSCSLTPESAQGQERALAKFAELTMRFSARPAGPTSALQRRFERTITDSDKVAEDLRAALRDPTLLKITYGEALPQKLQNAWEVELSDGTTLSFPLTTKPEFAVRKRENVEIHDNTGDYTIPVAAIRSIRPQRDLHYDPAWNAYMSEHSGSDAILIRKPNGVLDHLEGVALRCTPTHLEFNYDGEVLHASYAKIEGLRLASRSADNKAPVSTTCALIQTGAHRIRCKELRLSDESSPKLQVETPAGATLAVGLTPLVIDRTGSLALTAHELTIESRRLPLEDWQLISQSAHRWPLAASPSTYTVTRQGIETQLTIHGPAEIDIDVPKGYSHLVFALAIAGVPVAPVTFYFKEPGSDSKVIYQQPRFPNPEQVLDLRNDLSLPGAGILRIHVPGDARFSTFLLRPDNE
jgi:hypothetical protein